MPGGTGDAGHGQQGVLNGAQDPAGKQAQSTDPPTSTEPGRRASLPQHHRASPPGADAAPPAWQRPGSHSTPRQARWVCRNGIFMWHNPGKIPRDHGAGTALRVKFSVCFAPCIHLHVDYKGPERATCNDIYSQ